MFKKDLQYYKFCLYGFLKNQRFFEPFLILFLLEKNLNYFQIGSIYSIRMITRMFFEIPSGVAADVIGRRVSMIFSYSMYLISFFWYYFSPGYVMLITATVIFALGDAFRTGTHKAMIFEYLKLKGWTNQKVNYYGHTRSWSQTGSALSSLISGFIVFYSGNYSNIFLFSGIPYIIGLVLLTSYPKALEGIHTGKGLKAIPGSFKEIGKEIFLAFKNIRILKSIANLASFSGYFNAVKDYLQPLLSTLALSLPVFIYMENDKRKALVVGMAYFILYLLTSRASKNSGKIVKKFGYFTFVLNAMLIAGLIAGILSGLFYRFHLTLVAVLLFIIMYVIENMRRPVAVGYITELFSDKILASVLSVESQAKDLVGAVFALVFGFFANKWGIANSLMITSGLILIVSPFYLIGVKSNPISGKTKNFQKHVI